MVAFPVTARVHLFAVGLHLATYTSAAVYAQFTEAHRDFAAFYASAAFATVLHLGVVYAEEAKKCGDSTAPLEVQTLSHVDPVNYEPANDEDAEQGGSRREDPPDAIGARPF